MDGNIVAIVGRPNVGKSTLFNRLLQRREAIVDAIEGVTRDRHYGKSFWNGVEFSVIDTGGYIVGSEDIFEEEIRKQVLIAINEANVILFLVDVHSGITKTDTDIANILRKNKKNVILVINKVDDSNHEMLAPEFYKLGLGDYYTISSISGKGTGDLLDIVVKLFPKKITEIENENIPKFTIVGRPNVGKSTFVNTLLGEERTIVTNIAGTTRDTIETKYDKFGKNFYLIDTAGIRKKSKIEEDIEFYSVMRSIRAIENSDVVFLMIDATKGLESQDLNIFSLIEKNNRGAVIFVNKWDLIENKDSNTMIKYKNLLLEKIKPFNDVPIIFISALTKQNILKGIEIGEKVYNNRIKKISTSKLNEYILDVIERTPPPSIKGKYVKIKFATQLPTHTPQFAFFCNLPQYVQESYKRFIENKIREKYDFSGVPIRIYMRKK